MFAVEWLKQGVTVERETSALANLADAVATARARAEAVVARHPRDEPDSFRLVDSSGAVLILSSSLPGGGSRKRKATTPSASDPRQERLGAQLTSFHCEFRRLYCGRWRATICRAKCYVEKPDIIILVSHEDHPRRSRRNVCACLPSLVRATGKRHCATENQAPTTKG